MPHSVNVSCRHVVAMVTIMVGSHAVMSSLLLSLRCGSHQRNYRGEFQCGATDCRDLKTSSMKATALLILACCCSYWCVCEPVAAESVGQTPQCSTNGPDGHCGLCLPHMVINMAEKISQLEARLQNTEKEVLELRGLTADRPQVAFSAALRDSGAGDTGPFTTAVPLQYKRVFSNIGNSYNPSTGIFTAQVKGMYFFQFTMFNNQKVVSSVVSLRKNGEMLVSLWDIVVSDINDSGSNAVVISLEVGDSVYVELHANRIVYDDSSLRLNTFTGFLLFTM